MTGDDPGSPLQRAKEIRKQVQIIQEQEDDPGVRDVALEVEMYANVMIDKLEGQ